MTEIALIAFDGVDPRTIYKNRDELPNIDSVLEDSIHGEWTTPGHTIPSFTATLTGRNYEVVNFHWDEGKGEFQRHRQTGFDYLWDITDSSMTLLNMPVLYPPENIDDVMVCGFLTPDSLREENLAKPQEVQEALNEKDYIPDVHADRTFEELGGEGMFSELKDMMEYRSQVARWLIEKYNSDLFYSVWTATDRWFHQCHQHDVEHFPMYEEVDRIVGKMVDYIENTFGDIPIILFSDHGFAHYPTDGGVHKGHMHKGWYCIKSGDTPSYRDDTASIFDLFPTVLNYLGEEIPDYSDGRVLLHTEEQDGEVEKRLSDLGYLE